MTRRIPILIAAIFINVNLMLASSFYIDITKDQFLASKSYSSITFNEWNEIYPTYKTERMIDQVEDMIYRFDVLDDWLYFVKYNNQQVMRYNTKNKTMEIIFEESNRIITDLTVHEKRVYISIIPDGEIYVFEGKEFKLFYSSKAKYIWDIEASDHGLALITGNPCYISILDNAGEPLQRYSLSDINGSMVKYNRQNRYFYSGTSNNGLIYEINPARKTIECLYQKPNARIITIAFDKDTTYFAEVVKQDTPLRQQSSSNVVTVTAQDPGQPSSFSEASTESSSQFQQFIQAENILSNIYKFQGDSKNAELLYSQGSAVYDFMVIKGCLYILSDEPGLIRINIEKPWVTRKSSFNVSSMLSFLKIEKDYYISTGYPGYIYRFYPDKFEKSEWISNVLSMDAFVEFGRIAFDADSHSAVSLRAGNSLLPDSSWSEWYSYSKPSGLEDLPGALFFQVRVNVDNSRDAFIKGLRIYLRSLSSFCRIKDIKITRERMNPGGMPSRPRPTQYYPGNKVQFERVHPYDPQKPLVISWNYENNEQCQEQTRISLTLKDLESGMATYRTVLYNTSRYEIDRAFFPDGSYYAALGLSPFFPEDEVRVYNSDIFIIDNTPPDIIIGDETEEEIMLKVTDKRSVIALASIEYINGERVYIEPADKIFDSREETFRLKNHLLDKPCLFTVYDMEGNKNSILMPVAGVNK